MDKKQAQNIVVETLQNSFDKERFLYFVKNFLNSIDESKAFHARGHIKDSFKKETGIIKTYERIGTYTDPEGKKIDILVVYLQKPKSIDKARTAQRDFVAHYLKDRNQKDAGLVAFVSPDPTDWRFSLVKMEYKFEEGKSGKIKVKEEFTPAKRWSFLVGAHENSHTAQSRLVPIVEDDSNSPTLLQIEEAFNIEKVTKEFFEKYRDLFFRVSESLSEIVKKNKTVYENFWEISGASKKEDVERFIENFVKKLLGQIVFLYFLQKKGWFGVPMKKNWGDGDKKFLRTLFEEAQEKGRNYFNDYLEPLFYEALAKERDNDYYSRFDCKIPFLNGGLFDPISDYDWVNTAINLPDELFSNDNLTKEKDEGNGILDIFDRYNFTVKEDEPLEKEVAVDPEMLGKVFENLLEVKDRKSKGTYYTPREIVHYMCQESLVNYLKTETKVDEKRIRQLVNQDIFLTKKDVESGKNKVMILWEGEYDDLDKALKNIKIVDPACGSGAFLVGMLQEIVKARKMLQAFNGKRKSEYLLREETIQNCIYGVDIDPGATEIAKLRLWLSLIVEEDDIKNIKPLPNLDYKIMQGNSLLEEFEGVKLFNEEFIAGVDTGKEKKINDLGKRQNELSGEYIKLHQAGELTDAKKAEIDAELKKIMKDLKRLSEPKKENNNFGLFDASDEAKEKAERLKQLHKEFFETTQKKKKDELKKQIEKLEWELIEATLKKEGKTSALKKLKEFKKSNTKPFFLWKLNFAEVFQEKGGFDIVIANPPYLEFDELRLKDENFIFYRDGFNMKYKFNLFSLFLKKGPQLLKNSGIISYIAPNSFSKEKYNKDIREDYIKNMNIISFVDFTQEKKPVFENASNDSYIVFLVEKSKTSHSSIKIDKYLDGHFEYSHSINQKDLLESFDYQFNVSSNNDLIKKIAQGTVPLGKIALIRVGLTPSKPYKNKYGDDYENFSKKYLNDKRLYSFLKKNKKVDICDRFRILHKTDTIIWDRNCLYKDKVCPGEFEDYCNPKLIFRNRGNKMLGSYDESNIFVNDIFNVAVLKYRYKKERIDKFSQEDIELSSKFSEKYLLSIINSKIIKFYLWNSFVFRDIKSPMMKKFPIKKISFEDQKPFINLVDQILEITSASEYDPKNPPTKQKELEKKIDELVYKLYGLTEEEIRIVEKNK